MNAIPLISNAQWQIFRQTINNASATFNTANIIWKHLTKRLAFDGDDRPNTTDFEDIPLLALVQYNVFRVWPADKLTDQGKIQKDAVVVILNKDYLRDLGYINANGNFNYLPDYDRFWVDNKPYKEMGGSQASQALVDPLLIYLILAPEELDTGQEAQ
jgi:hypothetical protein